MGREEAGVLAPDFTPKGDGRALAADLLELARESGGVIDPGRARVVAAAASTSATAVAAPSAPSAIDPDRCIAVKSNICSLVSGSEGVGIAADATEPVADGLRELGLLL